MTESEPDMPRPDSGSPDRGSTTSTRNAPDTCLDARCPLLERCAEGPGNSLD